MTTKRALVVTGVIATLLTGRLVAQISLDRWVFLTSEQLIASAGSERDAASFVGAVFTTARQFLTRGDPRRPVTMLSRQVPERWLPTTSDVQFVRLDDAAANDHLNQCGVLTVLQSFTGRTRDSATVTIAHVRKCESSFQSFHLQRVGHEWRLHNGVVGSGGGTGTSHCSC